MNRQRLLPVIRARAARVEAGLCTNWKQELRWGLIIYRMLIRSDIAQLMDICQEHRKLIRCKRKLANSGAEFILLNNRIERSERTRELYHQFLVDDGESIFEMLDAWQSEGATLQDLCDLCSVPYLKALQSIKPDGQGEPFSGLMFVHNLDFKDEKADFITMEVDAPFTHAIKEYMLHLMTHAPDAESAAHQALENCFPNLMGKAIYAKRTEGVTQE